MSHGNRHFWDGIIGSLSVATKAPSEQKPYFAGEIGLLFPKRPLDLHQKPFAQPLYQKVS